MTCPEGSEVVLTCEVSKPDAKVTWTKKGKVIKPDDNYEIVVEGKVHKLIIKHATMDDIAEFTAALDAKQKTACKVTVEGQYQNISFLRGLSTNICFEFQTSNKWICV